MSYLYLTYAHLSTVVPGFVIGTYIMASRKGTDRHRALGKIYLILMTITSVITLFMEARVGPQLLNHFGVIHSLSLLTLFSVPMAYYHARRRNVPWHMGFMIGTYIGALLIAGALAFSPGRFLHALFLA